MQRVVTVANRTPGATTAAGGLAVALKKVLGNRDGFWFGWSGKIDNRPSDEANFRDVGNLTVASIDLTQDEHSSYYAGYSNSILWPAFHLRLDLATMDPHWYEGYRRVNARFAASMLPHLRPDDLIWVHDYHLIPLATELRALGVKNRIGIYLHIPFPSAEAFHAIPHHAELLKDFSAYDLIGFQANRDVDAFESLVSHQVAASLPGMERPEVNFESVRVEAIPIGSDPDEFARLATSPAATKMINRMQRVLGDSKLIFGVDRLDYSKGLPYRIEAYESLLTNHPELRRNVHFLQVAPPSRDSIKEYREISETLDSVCGRVMGKFSEPDWQPLTYVKRPYGQASLAGLNRLSRIGLVTPLRDGMNLIAHEWIASQDPENPGALVLSRFAGAAELFDDALQVNPFDTEETADAMNIALEMPLGERIERWKGMIAAARKYSVDHWAQRFLSALSEEDTLSRGELPDALGEAMPDDLAKQFGTIAANLRATRSDDDDQTSPRGAAA